MEMKATNFYNDIKRGSLGERIFKEDFLDHLGINYIDVTNSQKFRLIDTDFKTKIGNYEIKTSYKDNEILIFEEYTNINETLCPKSLGWIYKTEADLIIFVSKNTRTMIFLPFNEKFKNHYKTIRKQTKLIRNKITVHNNGNKWQSAFRIVPFKLLNGFISIYRKNH